MMSYKYGINGYDLNWENVESLEDYCFDCMKEMVRNNLNSLAELPEDYECQNHTHVYFEHKTVSTEPYVTTAMQFEEWVKKIVNGGAKPLTEVLDWYIVHDTNTNFVELYGEVPDEYLTEEYRKERDEAEARE